MPDNWERIHKMTTECPENCLKVETTTKIGQKHLGTDNNPCLAQIVTFKMAKLGADNNFTTSFNRTHTWRHRSNWNAAPWLSCPVHKQCSKNQGSGQHPAWTPDSHFLKIRTVGVFIHFRTCSCCRAFPEKGALDPSKESQGRMASLGKRILESRCTHASIARMAMDL